MPDKKHNHHEYHQSVVLLRGMRTGDIQATKKGKVEKAVSYDQALELVYALKVRIAELETKVEMLEKSIGFSDLPL